MKQCCLGLEWGRTVICSGPLPIRCAGSQQGEESEEPGGGAKAGPVLERPLRVHASLSSPPSWPSTVYLPCSHSPRMTSRALTSCSGPSTGCLQLTSPPVHLRLFLFAHLVCPYPHPCLDFSPGSTSHQGTSYIINVFVSFACFPQL